MKVWKTPTVDIKSFYTFETNLGQRDLTSHDFQFLLTFPSQFLVALLNKYSQTNGNETYYFYDANVGFLLVNQS